MATQLEVNGAVGAILQGCARCCGRTTYAAKGLECPRVNDADIDTPLTPCGLPDMAKQIENGTTDPSAATVEIIDEMRQAAMAKPIEAKPATKKAEAAVKPN